MGREEEGVRYQRPLRQMRVGAAACGDIEKKMERGRPSDE